MYKKLGMMVALIAGFSGHCMHGAAASVWEDLAGMKKTDMHSWQRLVAWPAGETVTLQHVILTNNTGENLGIGTQNMRRRKDRVEIGKFDINAPVALEVQAVQDSLERIYLTPAVLVGKKLSGVRTEKDLKNVAVVEFGRDSKASGVSWPSREYLQKWAFPLLPQFDHTALFIGTDEATQPTLNLSVIKNQNYHPDRPQNGPRWLIDLTSEEKVMQQRREAIRGAVAERGMVPGVAGIIADYGCPTASDFMQEEGEKKGKAGAGPGSAAAAPRSAYGLSAEQLAEARALGMTEAEYAEQLAAQLGRFGQ